MGLVAAIPIDATSVLSCLGDVKSVIEFANSGGLVLGICNGLQILTETGLLPGVLLQNKYQKFMVDIKYNALTKAQFNIVYTFLLQRQASLEAFFVELPQYGNSNAGTKTIGLTSSVDAGSVELTLNNINSLSVADMFNISDPQDSTHGETYKITKISGSVVTITPPLQRKLDHSLAGTRQANFGTPKMRVSLVGPDIQYSVDAKGLYSFSVKLEETRS